MKVPFVTFKPLERELDKEIRSAFERVYERSWYIEGFEDKNFEESFSKYCDRTTNTTEIPTKIQMK